MYMVYLQNVIKYKSTKIPLAWNVHMKLGTYVFCKRLTILKKYLYSLGYNKNKIK